MKKLWIILSGLLWILTSCTSPSESQVMSEENATSQPVSYSQGALTTETEVFPMTDSVNSTAVPDTTLQSLIDRAKDDLSERLGIDIVEINVIQADAATWPDASVGCPQEGMMYAQVLTDGYLVLLEANDKQYEYHTGKSTQLIYCENPSPPSAGTSGDV